MLPGLCQVPGWSTRPKQLLSRHYSWETQRHGENQDKQNRGSFDPTIRWFYYPPPYPVNLRNLKLNFIASAAATKLYSGLSTAFYGVFRRVVFSSSVLDRAQRVPHRTTQLRDAMKSAVKAASSSLFSILFPSDCRICHAPLTNIASLPVCEPCLARIVPLEGPLCQICGEKLFHPNAEAEDVPLCPICRRVGAHFRRAAAFGAYEGALRDLIHLFKYNGVRPAGKVLGGLLSQTVATMALPDSVISYPGAVVVGQAHGARLQSGGSHCPNFHGLSEFQQHPIRYINPGPDTRDGIADRAHAPSAAG